MHRWILFSLLIASLVIPGSAGAQNQVGLSSVYIQLWPEFDQPNMLVIYDLTVSENASLPMDLPVRIPLDASQIVVAYEQDGDLLNAPFEEPYVDDDWQVVSLKIDTGNTYRLEYYAPLEKIDLQRKYEFSWLGDFPVEQFLLRLRVPVDTTEVNTDPEMTASSEEETYLDWETENLAAGQTVSMNLTYTKTTDRLATSGAPLQAGPVDDDTPGRVSLNNYLPYLLGGVGMFLILAGIFYFWQSGLRQSQPRKRRRSKGELDDKKEIYCHQCGKRAQPGDRFCRTCGTRLRLEN